MLKFGITVAAVLVVAVIVYGGLQAQEGLSGGGIDVATSTVVAISQPTATALQPTTPEIPVPSASALVFQVRGGDNPCRYLYMNNRVGTFADVEIDMMFVAGTHDNAGLAATGEMHLYGDTGPHLFEVEDAGGNVIASLPVVRGGNVSGVATFPGAGLYKLFDRLYEQPVHVSEISARYFGEPGYVPVTGWCPPEDSAP